MKTRKLFFAFLLVPVLLFGQTNVDKLSRSLESLSTASYDDWRVSPDLKTSPVFKGDPIRPDFDDLHWDTLRIDQSLFVDSCWLRKEIVLPDRILGQPVTGRIKFLVTVDDYGFLWINGESRGRFDWDGEFVLTENGKPGDKFLMAIKAVNTGGPLRLLRARIQMENETDATQRLRQKIQDFTLSLRVGQKLLSLDTYQTNSTRKEDPGIDKSAMDKEEKKRLNNTLQGLAGQVDTEALRRGDTQEFLNSMETVRAQLKPVDAFAKRFTIVFTANAHIDAAWLWREKETVEVCRNTFSSVLKMMDARADFTYTQSSAAYYDWMERLYPDIFSRIRQRVKEGRWEVAGGMWVEPDCNLPSGESWMHHLLYAKRYFRNHLGANVIFGWNPDSFGYHWNMPQFYRNAGIDAFITQKIGWNETNVFPYRVFWWESPDGSRILCYFPFDYVNNVAQPYQLVDWLRQFEANTGFTRFMILFGVGDHGGGPSDEMLDRIEHFKSLDIYPRIEYGTASAYLNWLKKQDPSKIPTWKDELYLEYHQGTYTTQAKMKEFNRRNETLLSNAEKFSALASLFGGNVHKQDMEEAWRNLMFNQFHDILPGSGIREVYLDATERHKAAEAVGDHELHAALETIARKINTSSLTHGKPLVIFNPLSWERTDLATVELPEADQNDYAVLDSAGKEIVSQILPKDNYHRRLIFVAEKIPSLGYKVYQLRKQKPSLPKTSSLTASSFALESEFFRVKLGADSGWVESIFDKRLGKEILSGSGNQLQILEDKPRQWDAWNIGLTGKTYPSTLRKIEVVENGPVRAILRVHRDVLGPSFKREFPTEGFPSSFFIQDVILYSGLDRIDFKTHADWWEEKTMLKVAFPLTVQDQVATYEIPYGQIQRSTQMSSRWEKAKVEVPAERWADLSQDDFGVSLLNRSKYGYAIKGNLLRLSLLRSPQWPDPTADRGKHSIEYALYPHVGRVNEAQTVARGYEYNNPLITVQTGSHSGELPLAHSFIQISPSSLVLTTIKKTEDSDAWIFQWYDSKGVDSQAMVTLPQNARKVVRSNFLEEEGEPVPFEKNVVKVNSKKRGVVTLKVYFAQSAEKETHHPAPQGHGRGKAMSMSSLSMSSLNAAGFFLMEQASGTSHNPGSSPMEMRMLSAGNWNFMLHGMAFVADIQQTGPRGHDKFFSASWFMGMTEHPVGKGSVMLRAMMSLDPATITQRRYPLLFQTGETAFGRPLVDAQHPHDLIMELGIHYARPLSEKTMIDFYFAPVGDPALGPVAFPHRVSAAEFPQATLAHHLQDSTHIANEVVTTGIKHGMFRIEASGFHGAEPNENRWNIDHGAIDSWSTRLTLAPTDNWSGQISIGRLNHPEASEEGDVVRSTASITYNKPTGSGHWASSLIWGRNHKTAEHQNINSYLAESVLQFHQKDYLSGRFELVDKDELFDDQPDIKQRLTRSVGSVFRIQAYTLGYTRDIQLIPGVLTGWGGNFTLYVLPAAIKPFYGNHPASFVFYLRLKLKGSEHPHHHLMP